jgi:hypothetical protein
MHRFCVSGVFFWKKKLFVPTATKWVQLNFAPKIFGRNLVDLGEFPPNQQIFGWAWTKFAQIEKKRPQILGRNLTARIRSFSDEQQLLCGNFTTFIISH